jgi:hypothetical protein
MRTTLPGSVGFVSLSARVVESYLKDMTPASGPSWQVRPPGPLKVLDTAVLYVVFLKHRRAILSIADNSLIEDDFCTRSGAPRASLAN